MARPWVTEAWVPKGTGWPSPGARPDALRPDGLEPGDQWVDGQMEPGGRMTWA